LEASKPIIYHTDTASPPHKYATQLQNKLDVEKYKARYLHNCSTIKNKRLFDVPATQVQQK